MPSETQTKSGTCPRHGSVEATRELPKPSFPFFVYAVRRYLAGKRPYRCPECGSPVT